MTSFKSKPALALASLLALGLVGCGGNGGSGSSSSRATLHMSVEWPEHLSRFVPNAANSVVATVTVKGKPVAHVLLRRPNNARSYVATAETSIDLNQVPVGDALVTMTAYPEADGTGTAQAAGVQTIHLVKGASASVDASLLASTAVRVALAPNDEPTLTSVLFVRNAGYLPNILATGYDAQNRMVLLETHGNPEDMVWTSDDPSVATVSPAGDVDGPAVGSTTVRVSVNVGGAAPLLASIPVQVKQVQSLALSPYRQTTTTVTTAAPIQFAATATFTDGSQADVTKRANWSAPMSSGTVSDAGLMEWGALAGPGGMIHVVATIGGFSDDTFVSYGS